MNSTAELSVLSQTLNQLLGLQWPWLDLLIISSLVISLLLAVVSLGLLRRGARQREQLRQTCRQLSHDLQIAGNSAIGMGQRIVALERRMAEQQQHRVETQKDTLASVNQSLASAQSSPGVQSHAVQSPNVQLQTVKPSQPESDAATTAIDTARDLLGKGMSEQEVAKRCGLSDAEAALMAMVMRQQGLAAVG